MNLASALFPATWHWIMLVLSVLIVSRVVQRAPWRRLLDSSQLNLLLGFAVGLTLLWSLRAGVKPGLSLHMLGAMAATLTLGPWLALVALGLLLALAIFLAIQPLLSRRPSRRALILATRGQPAPERLLSVARILGHLPAVLRPAAYGAAPPPSDTEIERAAARPRGRR